MYVPSRTRHLIIDAPAGSAGVLLQEMLARSSTVLVPLVPSIIDLHATGNFLRELTATGPVKYGHVRMAVIANKVRRSMPAYAPLQTVLDSLGLQLLARLIDSDVFLRAAESGAGIFELNPRPGGCRAQAVHADHRMDHRPTGTRRGRAAGGTGVRSRALARGLTYAAQSRRGAALLPHTAQ